MTASINLPSPPPPREEDREAVEGAGGRASASPSLLVVVGMAREARIVGSGAREQDPEILIGTDHLATVLESRPACVISFGLCGGLDPTLAAGDLVIGSGVIAPMGFTACDPEWIGRLAAKLPGARHGSIPATPDIIDKQTAKAELRAQSGGIAVDIESGRVAIEAKRANVPFAILRCVSDAAYRTLPRSAVAGFADNGQVKPARVLAGLIRRPWELPELIRTARHAERAFRSLRDARHLLGPGLGCPYLGEHLVDMA